MKLTIVKKNLLSWTAMHIDFVMCNTFDSTFHFIRQDVPQTYHSLEKTVSHFSCACRWSTFAEFSRL